MKRNRQLASYALIRQRFWHWDLWTDRVELVIRIPVSRCNGPIRDEAHLARQIFHKSLPDRDITDSVIHVRKLDDDVQKLDDDLLKLEDGIWKCDGGLQKLADALWK
jgi:hypothetical protein